MLKRTYKILKYIHRNPNITKAKLIKKFDNFEKYRNTISEYVNLLDENINSEQLYEEKFMLEADKQGMNVSEIARCVEEKMQDIEDVIDDTLIYYSTNLRFDEYYEKKKHDALLFWLPYSITTLLALGSLFVN